MYLSDILQSAVKLSFGIGCVLLFAASVAGLQALARTLVGPSVPKVSPTQFLSLFLFAFLGFVIGLVMAASRDAAVGAVVPASLTFVGGVAVFLFGKPEYDKAIVFSAAFGFSAMMLFGTVLGSYERARAVEYARSAVPLLRAAETEFLVNAFRTSRGLAPLRPAGAESEDAAQ